EEGQGYKPNVLPLMIQTVAKQGKKDEALKLADNYIKLRKDWRAYRLKGSVQHELGLHAEAIKSYESALSQAKKADDEDDKPQIVRDLRYIMSNVYLDMNNVDKAAEYLKLNLKEKPDDPTYNNDLGYIWADHDQNLDESEKMIRKALEEDRK